MQSNISSLFSFTTVKLLITVLYAALRCSKREEASCDAWPVQSCYSFSIATAKQPVCLVLRLFNSSICQAHLHIPAMLRRLIDREDRSAVGMVHLYNR